MSTGSKAARSSSRFVLSDLHEVISKGIVVANKEKPIPTPVLPKLPQPKLIDAGSKRKRILESIELIFESLGPGEAVKNMGSLAQTVSDHVSRSVDGLKARAEKTE